MSAKKQPKIVTSPHEQKFCHRVNYHHDLDLIQNNPQTKNFCKRYTQSFHVRRIPNKHASLEDYNKYYIKPELRYKKKIQDPRNQLKQQGDQKFLYKNLHNRDFWNWVHPFQPNIKQQNKSILTQRINPKILQKFKGFIQQDPNRRLPLVVQSALTNKL